jgi:hypothetical protein
MELTIKMMQERLAVLRREQQAALSHVQLLTGAIRECANNIALLDKEDKKPEANTEGDGI